MPSLETVIRPLQSLDPSPLRVDLTDVKNNSPTKLVFGKSGGGKTIGASLSYSAKWYKDTKSKEKTTR